jgi:CspA family cold shock protein
MGIAMKTFLVAAIAVLISSQAFAANGTVRWFNAAKGYGFIIPDGGGKDVFVHISAVEASGLTTLKDGQKIEYDPGSKDQEVQRRPFEVEVGAFPVETGTSAPPSRSSLCMTLIT